VGAINFEQEQNTSKLKVSAVIAATGFEVFDATEKRLLGYGQYPNVLTGFDLERIFSTADPMVLPVHGMSILVTAIALRYAANTP